MRAAFGDGIFGDFARVVDVADVQHVADTAHGDAFVGREIEERRQYFVADEKIIAIAKD